MGAVMKTRQWQARVTGPEERVVTFGVQAADLPAAILKAHQQSAGLAWIPDQVTVIPLPGRRGIPPG
jgi:hypothetical protein